MLIIGCWSVIDLTKTKLIEMREKNNTNIKTYINQYRKRKGTSSLMETLEKDEQRGVNLSKNKATELLLLLECSYFNKKLSFSR